MPFTKKIFCVFLHSAPVHLILSAENSPGSLICAHSTIIDRTILNNCEDFEFTQEFNTIGKQFAKFEAMGGPVKLYQFLNYMWGKALFNNEYVLFKYALIEKID